jgi:hypothetical protein
LRRAQSDGWRRPTRGRIKEATVTDDEKREILEEIIEKMDEIAGLIHALNDDAVNAYCLAAFEGKDAGWLGHFERDIIQEALAALDDEGDDES